MTDYTGNYWTVFNGIIVGSKRHHDADITWWVEDGIKTEFDLTSSQLQLHEKGSCCGQFERIVYSHFMKDHVGQGRKERHVAFCRWCGAQLSWSLPHKINTETIKDFEMPIGKHKGKKLSDIPKDYLDWAVTNMDGNLKRKIAAYLQKEK